MTVSNDPIMAGRVPISAETLAHVVAVSRANWQRMMAPRRRPSARWDIESVLVAEVEHTLVDLVRLSSRGMPVIEATEVASQWPVDRYRLPRERLAGEALTALRTASLIGGMVTDRIETLRKQREAGWAREADATTLALRERIEARRRAWHVFLDTYNQYRKSTLQ